MKNLPKNILKLEECLALEQDLEWLKVSFPYRTFLLTIIEKRLKVLDREINDFPKTISID